MAKSKDTALRQQYATPEGVKIRGENLVQLRPGELRTFLVPFAEQGYSIYDRLFRVLKDLDGVTATRLPIVGAALHSLLSRPQLIVLRCDVPLFPWAFLYPNLPDTNNLRETLRPARFWGFRHEFQQRVLGTSDIRILPYDARLVAAICPDTDNGRHAIEGHPFVHLQNAGRLRRLERTAELTAHLRDFKEECLYFYGHAHHDDVPIPSTSYIQLGQDRLRVSHLSGPNRPCFEREVVVAFLNGCRMAHLHEWEPVTMVGYLCLESGNRLCCILPVGDIPEAFAAEAARLFWSRFLAEVPGLPLGSALRHAHLAMLRQWRNPLGLLYTVFGRVDTRVHDKRRVDA